MGVRENLSAAEVDAPYFCKKKEMIRSLFILGISLACITSSAQDEPLFASHSITVDNLEDAALDDFLRPHMENTQFVMVGEQHFIQEVGMVTKAVYELAEEYGYRTLCIENDALMAEQITRLAEADDPAGAARAFHQQFPFTVAFYENDEDYDLLGHVVKSGGELWGIDQTLMSQFRFNYSYLIEHTKSAAFAEKLQEQLDLATASYEEAMSNKSFQAVYYFKYNEALNEELLALAQTPAEKEVIFQLGKTKEIYDYNLSGQYYLNNEIRGQLMKSNFMRYYRAAQESEEMPKVVFKLGASHTYRGLTPTRIYDISNLVTELANMNGQRSFHIKVLGISGTNNIGFPFAPAPMADFDNTEDFPQEIQDWLEDLPDDKYAVLNLEPLRVKARSYSAEMQKLMFAHDVLILVRDAQPLSTF